jgi:hypothetical protein
MSEEKEAFLDRWSRLKQEKPAEKPVVQETKEEEPAPPLQPVEELNTESDFKPFMNPKVDGETRRAALKKLFADAHYNIPDPFEAYSEDWTVGEPIPLEMLKTLNHAQNILFSEPEPKPTPPEGSAPEPAQAEAPQPEDQNVAGKQDA